MNIIKKRLKNQQAVIPQIVDELNIRMMTICVIITERNTKTKLN